MPKFKEQWSVTPHSGGDAPFHAVDPDGHKHGPFDTWQQARDHASTQQAVIDRRELRERQREIVPTLLALRARGATQINTSYSGSGDEGSFDQLEVTGAEPTAEEQSALEEHFDEVLYARYGCWQDNEGGFGEFNVYLSGEDLSIEHVHNWYTEAYETESQTDHLLADVEPEPPQLAQAA